MNDHGMLMTALPSKNAATKIAKILIKERLAACVQLIGMESFYTWKGAMVNAPESLLLIKTRKAQFAPAMARIKEMHPYSVPEIVATEFVAGFAGYLAWIDDSTGPAPKAEKKKVEEKKPVAPKKPSHPQSGNPISARGSARVRPGVSRPMRVK